MACFLVKRSDDGQETALLVDDGLLSSPVAFELREILSLASAAPIPAADMPADSPLLVWQSASGPAPAFSAEVRRLSQGRSARVLRIGAKAAGVDFDWDRLHVSAALCRRRIVSRPDAELRLADGPLAPILRVLGFPTQDRLWSVLREGEDNARGIARRSARRAKKTNKSKAPDTSLITFGRVRLRADVSARLVLACQMSGLDVRDMAGKPHPAGCADTMAENRARLMAAQAELLAVA